MVTDAPAGAHGSGRAISVVLASLSVMLVTIAAAILLPSLAIEAASWFTDETALAGLASRMAETLALLGAVMVAALLTAWNVRFVPPRGWLALVAGSGVFATVAAAYWVRDVDGWTLATAVLIPCAVALMGWRKRRRAG